MTAAMHTFTAIYSISSLQICYLSVFPLPAASRFFFSFLWSKQPKVVVFAVNLGVGTFSENVFSLFFLRALFLCVWTSSVVFAGFRSIFHFDRFWPKPRYWIFRQFHSLDSLFL